MAGRGGAAAPLAQPAQPLLPGPPMIPPPTIVPVPQRLIGLLGLEQHHDAFIRNMMMEEPDIAVKSIPSLDALPVRKERRQYDAYKPKGILSRSWIAKHQQGVCGCVCVLFNWEGQDRMAFEAALATYLERVRAAIRGRNTRVLVVLVSSRSLPGADPNAPANQPLLGDAELTSLRRRCDLDQRNLFVMSSPDFGTACRKLASAASDSAAEYYKLEARRAKKSKGEISRPGQPYLATRHRFKVAWFYEALRDTIHAQKYYRQAYDSLFGVTVEMYPRAEIRGVGEALADKITSMLLDANDARGAMEFFALHMRWFATMVEGGTGGIPPLQSGVSNKSIMSPVTPQPQFNEFAVTPNPRVANASGMIQFYDDLCRQNECFGDRVTQFMQRPQHVPFLWTMENIPAYFYHTAATTVQQRREVLASAEELYAEVQAKYATTIPELTFVESEFIGQPPVITNHPLAAEGTEEWEVKKIDFNFLRVMQQERAVDHNLVQLRVLTKTHQIYRSLKYTRAAQLVMSEIAGVHIARQDIAEAKAMLDRCNASITESKWYSLGRTLQLQGLQCCEKLGDTAGWIGYALYYLANPAADQEDQMRKFQALLTFLRGQAEPTMSALPQMTTPTEVKLTRDHPFIRVRTQFTSGAVLMYDTVTFRVWLRALAPLPLPITQVTVEFSQPKYNQVIGSFEHPLLVPVGDAAVFEFPLTLSEEGAIQCTAVILDIGKPGTSVRLVWNYGPLTEVTGEVSTVGASVLDVVDGASNESTGPLPFVERPICIAHKLKPKLTIEMQHTPPVLLNEWYEMTVVLNANEDDILEGMLTIPNMEDIRPCLPGQESANESASPRVNPGIQLAFGPLASGTKTELKVLLRAIRAGRHVLALAVDYRTSLSPLQVVESVDLMVVYPFDIGFTFMDTMEWSTAEDAEPFLYGLSSCSAKYQVRTNTFTDARVATKPQQGQGGTVGSVYSSIVINQVPTGGGATVAAEAGRGDGAGVGARSFRVGQPIQLVTRLCTTTPYSIVIKSLTLVTNSNIRNLEPVNLEVNTRMDHGEEYQCSFVIVGSEESEHLATGCLHLVAHRVGEDRDVEFDFPLPDISLVSSPLSMSVQSPTNGVMGKPIKVKFLIKNRTTRVQDVQVQAFDSRSSYWSGRTQVNLPLLPLSTTNLCYTLIPSMPGTVALPSLHVRTKQGHTILTQNDQLNIFVFPDMTAVA